jgi:hypothetical protein
VRFCFFEKRKRSVVVVESATTTNNKGEEKGSEAREIRYLNHGRRRCVKREAVVVGTLVGF